MSKSKNKAEKGLFGKISSRSLCINTVIWTLWKENYDMLLHLHYYLLTGSDYIFFLDMPLAWLVNINICEHIYVYKLCYLFYLTIAIFQVRKIRKILIVSIDH